MPYFIENLTEIDIAKEIIINKGLVIKVATKDQQMIIKQLVAKYSNQNEHFGYQEFQKIGDLPSGGVKKKKRKKNDFRYCILEELDSTRWNRTFAKAFLLTDKEFFIPFGIARADFGISFCFSFDELSVFTYYNDENLVFNKEYKANSPNDFTEKDKIQVKENITMLNDFQIIKNDYPHIDKALEDFFKINEISNYSVFKIVSYFACLELLLVENSFEKLKSINRQLQTKINLLNNQFEKPIDVSHYIKGPDTLTLGKAIGIIYNYRSLVAHGDFLDFEKKLQVLKKLSIQDILRILRIVLKKILIFSLKEPKLISDLKNC